MGARPCQDPKIWGGAPWEPDTAPSTGQGSSMGPHQYPRATRLRAEEGHDPVASRSPELPVPLPQRPQPRPAQAPPILMNRCRRWRELLKNNFAKVSFSNNNNTKRQSCRN